MPRPSRKSRRRGLRALRPAGFALGALALAVGACACGAASSATSATLGSSVATAAAGPVAVSPQPGTPDASPATQISFLGAAGTRVSGVRVVGSRSGAHGGVLRRYATGTGESFLPSRPFRAGEKVTVHARAGAGAIGTIFTIAHQAAVSQKGFPLNAGDAGAVQHYGSAPTLTPSTVRITTSAKAGSAPGDLFLAPYQGAGAAGPMIADQQGNLVWFQPLPAGVVATNFQVEQYQGRPALVWWQGRVIQAGFGEGEDVVDDSSYRRLATIKAGNGYRADLHEVRITPEGTAWIDAFDPIETSLASVHGPSSGVLTDSVVQEIDVKTGLVMWEWHTLGHIAISESNNPVPSNFPWDYAHLNSADPGPSNDVLVSVRNTWTLYDVDIATGRFRWRLGGRHSSFRLGAATRFYWQHDAEFQPGGLISLFDNGSDPPKEKQSRGLLLRPDGSSHTVSLVRQYANPTKTLLAESQGNALSLPGGDWLLGYGRLPNFTEFDAAGHVLLDGTLGRDVQNFKTFLSPWTGRPTTSPAIVARAAGAGAISVAVSWNGATDVASWRVLAGASAGVLVPVASAAKHGFETTIAVPSAGPFVSVQALDSSGAVIGASRVLKV